jgi:hypothetical protein
MSVRLGKVLVKLEEAMANHGAGKPEAARICTRRAHAALEAILAGREP